MIYCAMPYEIEGFMDGDKTLKQDGLVTDAGAELIRKTSAKGETRARYLLKETSSFAYETQ